MSNLEANQGQESFDLSRARNTLSLLGYGVYRLYSGQPEFHRTDFENAIPTAVKKYVTPSRSHIVRIQAALSEAGYMSLFQGKAPQGGPPRVTMVAEEAVIEPLVDTLLDRVTHAGDTLPDILHIPESVETILNCTSFKEQLIAQVSGFAIEHSHAEF